MRRGLFNLSTEGKVEDDVVVMAKLEKTRV